MMDNPICRGCPGALMGDCEDCGVTEREEARRFHEEDLEAEDAE